MTSPGLCEMNSAISRRSEEADEPSFSPNDSEWYRQLPSPGCRTTRALLLRRTSTGPDCMPSIFFSLALLASGCLSRGFLNHGHWSVGCLPSHLSHFSPLLLLLLLLDCSAAAAFDEEDEDPADDAPPLCVTDTGGLLGGAGPGACWRVGVWARLTRVGVVRVPRPLVFDDDELPSTPRMLLLEREMLPLLLRPPDRMRSRVEIVRLGGTVETASRAPPRRYARSTGTCGGVERRAAPIPGFVTGDLVVGLLLAVPLEVRLLLALVTDAMGLPPR
jgi:hypothetical protein